MVFYPALKLNCPSVVDIDNARKAGDRLFQTEGSKTQNLCAYVDQSRAW